MTKEDDRRHKYALMLSAHRDEWIRFGRKHFKTTFDKDRAAVRAAFSATSSPEAALKRLESYFKGPAYKQWEAALKTVWLETGKASISYVHAFLNGKIYQAPARDDYSYDYISLKQDPAEAAAQATWEQRVDDTITGPAFKDKIVGMNTTTQDTIRRTVADGVSSGDGHYAIGQAVDEKLTTGWPGRGETISRTEANSAMNAATAHDGKHAAPDLWKKWASTGMENVRAAHEIADEGDPVSQDDVFIVDEEALDYPGDPTGSAENIVNCACCILFVDKPEGILGDIIGEARSLFREAVKGKSDTTDFMKDISSSTDGRLQNLKFALKTEKSTARKITGYLADDPNISVKEAAEKVTDSLRYTITYDNDANFVDKVYQSQDMLRSEGYQPLKLRNYFGTNQEGGYQGYDTVWEDSQGTKVEIKYHTEESLKIKEETHLIYQQERLETDPVKKAEMIKQMDGMWTDFSPPPDYNELLVPKK